MKKLFIAVLSCASILSAHSQNNEVVNKKGVPMLPQIGDWGIGMSATPFIDLAGNLIKINSGSTFSNPAHYRLLNGTQFFAKYMDDTGKMIRITLNTNLYSRSRSGFIQKDNQTDPLVVVEDHYSYSNQSLGLNIGREYRRGKTRLQGYYGFDAGFYIGGGSSHYRYGNEMTASQPYPSSTNWGNNLSSLGRVTESRDGFTFGLNAGAFVGAEYFIFPGFSVGAEAKYSLGFTSKGQGKNTYENWNNISNSASLTTVNTGKETVFYSNLYGSSLFLMLYF